MENIINIINEICGTNGCTTITEISKKMKVTYATISYWVRKYNKMGLVGIIYPGLGGKRQNYIYNKVCVINKH